MDLIQNIKDYFKKKDNNQDAGLSPAGVCPNCYGKQEWDGEYFKFMKGKNGNPNTETYNNFVQDVARKLGKITIDKDTYTCETCKGKYVE